jgi:hypothetical protein
VRSLVVLHPKPSELVRQHPVRANGWIAYIEYRLFYMLDRHTLWTWSDVAITLTAVFLVGFLLLTAGFADAR